nr:hypothetical protein [Bowdeniella nasicola]
MAQYRVGDSCLDVAKRPAASLVGGIALLAVMASGLFGTPVGLDHLEKFRVQSESATGLQTLSEHFPPGEAQRSGSLPIPPLLKTSSLPRTTSRASCGRIPWARMPTVRRRRSW